MRKGAGLYFNEQNEAFVRVTSVLDIISKPFLYQWYARECYYAMLKDPNIAEEDAINAARRKTDVALKRGSLVHSMVEALKHREVESFPEGLQGYLVGARKFMEENDLEIEIQEKTVFSKNKRFAGTLDMTATSKGKRFLIDWKTGRDLYDEADLQISAYQFALEEEGITVHERRIVLLKEDGTFKVVAPNYEIDAFISALNLWRWKNQKLVQEFQL